MGELSSFALGGPLNRNEISPEDSPRRFFSIVGSFPNFVYSTGGVPGLSRGANEKEIAFFYFVAYFPSYLFMFLEVGSLK